MSSKLPALNGKEVVAALKQASFQHVRTSGSHHILKRSSPPATVAVPVHSGRDLPTGTLNGIIKAAGLTKQQFLALL